ncbi:MAG: class F sortase [Jatrophihabitantaceae bacterium]
MAGPAHRGRRAGAVLVLCAGLALAMLPLGWLALHRPGDRQLNPGTAAALASSVPSQLDGTAQPSPTGTGQLKASTAPSIPVTGPGGSRPSQPALPVPVRLVIASMSVDAPVVAEGVSPDGQMSIPADIDTIGWYRWGPAPGASTGSVVLVGHVDSAASGPGVFFQLRTLGVGAAVSVTTADRRVHRYRVISREEFPKTAVPLHQIFGKSGPARLTLATCGGPFDTATRSYRDNIVITAVPS